MISRVAAAVARASLEPLLVRAGVVAAGLIALLVAAPPGVPTQVVAAAVVVAVLPAVAPRGHWATVLILVAVVAWLVDTGLPVTAGTEPAGQAPDPGRALLIAGALYLVHNLTGLAAVLPYDAVVAPAMVSRWLVRALGVIVVSSLLSMAVLAGLDQITGDRVYLVATLAGLACALAVAVLLRTLIVDHDRRRATGVDPGPGA